MYFLDRTFEWMVKRKFVSVATPLYLDGCLFNLFYIQAVKGVASGKKDLSLGLLCNMLLPKIRTFVSTVFLWFIHLYNC